MDMVTHECTTQCIHKGAVPLTSGCVVGRTRTHGPWDSYCKHTELLQKYLK